MLSSNAPDARIVLRLDDRGVMMAEAVRSGIGAQLLPCLLAVFVGRAESLPEQHQVRPQAHVLPGPLEGLLTRLEGGVVGTRGPG